MEQFQLRPDKNARKNRKRVGRGQGSGKGCTSGRGMNGQKSRSGSKTRPWFEGGQMPLQRRVPKRGFHNNFRKPVQAVNISLLSVFNDGETVDAASLLEKSIIKDARIPVKILGNGEIHKKLTVKADNFSASAREKLEKGGCTVQVVQKEQAEKGKKPGKGSKDTKTAQTDSSK